MQPRVNSNLLRLGRVAALIVLCSVFVSDIGLSAFATPDDSDAISSPRQSDASQPSAENDDDSEDSLSDSTAGESDSELTPDQLREVQAESVEPQALQGQKRCKILPIDASERHPSAEHQHWQR